MPARLHLHTRTPTPMPVKGVVKQSNNTVVYDGVFQVFFQVLPLMVSGHNGRLLTTYALIDSASDVTLINDELVSI